jgi:hypothetical protein
MARWNLPKGARELIRAPAGRRLRRRKKMALLRGRRLVGGGGGPARGEGKGSVISAAMGRESTIGGQRKRERARQWRRHSII